MNDIGCQMDEAIIEGENDMLLLRHSTQIGTNIAIMGLIQHMIKMNF